MGLFFPGLLPRSLSLCLSLLLPFSSVLTSNNIGSDLTDTETRWGGLSTWRRGSAMASV